MHVLILTHAYPPEIRSTSGQMAQLAEGLAALGHQVTVITPMPRYNLSENLKKERGWKIYGTEDKKGVRIIRVATLPIHMVGPLWRAFGYVSITLTFFILGLLQRRVDVIFAYSTPFTLGLVCSAIKFLKGARFIFNVQDIFPQSGIDVGLIRNKFLIWILRKIEIFMYYCADLITVHSGGNGEYIAAHLGSPSKVEVIPNCVDTDRVVPMSVEHSFRQAWGFNGEFIVLFAGVMGYGQDLDVVLDAASLLRDEKRIKFLLVGDGMEKPRLLERSASMGLSNTIFKPLVEEEQYPKLLAAADVCLVTLKPALKIPVVPSKIFGYWAAAKPVLGCLNAESDANTIINASGAGKALNGGNAKMLAEEIRALFSNPESAKSMGAQGRKLVEAEYSHHAYIRRYESAISKLI